ncbi:MAG: DNA cytosine methyltransferase [Acetobacteraceae bacterium]
MNRANGTGRSNGRQAEPAEHPTFVDVFAGCGGLSLGLERAGWRGLFAIEKDRFAFETLQANFLQANSRFPYCWPDWLPQKAWGVESVLNDYRAELQALRGRVDLLAGGPPCQGFSSAGRRRADDPRNAMVNYYLQLIDFLEPKFLLLENVRGIMLGFKDDRLIGHRPQINFADELVRELSVEYDVHTTIVRASEFGVPQARPRFILLASRRPMQIVSPLPEMLAHARSIVLSRYNLPLLTGAEDAISDFEIGRNQLVSCGDSRGFDAIGYKAPLTQFQRVMRDGFEGMPSDTRLARHTPPIRDRFADIIELCRTEGRSTRQLSPEMRNRFGITKTATRVLDPDKPAPTITSMPDDLLHYKEPRTLTVRENARLQTFPDWFVFKGKYTTGGHLRRQEVPRFTQVANAVPPLLAEILGETLLTLQKAVAEHAKQSLPRRHAGPLAAQNRYPSPVPYHQRTLPSRARVKAARSNLDRD